VDRALLLLENFKKIGTQAKDFFTIFKGEITTPASTSARDAEFMIKIIPISVLKKKST